MELHSRLSDRVAELLRTQIARDYRPGQKLPSEQALAAELDVSRASLRDALKVLFAEGIVDRRWGAGTFVRERGEPVAFDASEVSSTREVIRSSGHEPTLAYADAALGPASTEMTESLMLPAGSDLWRVERVFAVDGVPAVLIIDHLPEHVNGSRIDPTVLKDVDLDMMTMLRRFADTWIASSEGTIEAVAASTLVAERLAIAEGAPILRQRLMNLGPDETPLLCAESFHRNDLASFRIVRHAKGAGR